MTIRLWLLAGLLVGLSIPPVQVRADDAGARQIMQQVEDRDEGDNRTAEMEMLLIDKSGRERLRKIQTFQRKKDQDTYRLMFFLHPADVKDTAFLTYDYDDPGHDDDQWLFLPALRKTKRIATTDKSGSFMGSDLNYSDMSDRELEDYDFFLKDEVEVRGNPAWLIESIPRTRQVVEETGYTKSLLFVRKDNYFVVRAVSWVDGKRYLKYMDVTQLERIEGIWVATEMHVFKRLGKRVIHKTVLRLHDVKFNQDLLPELFTVRKMEAGL